MKTTRGIPVAPGIGLGRPCFYQEKIPEEIAGYGETGTADSHVLLFNAFNKLTEQLSVLAREAEACLDQSAAGIFHAHTMICAELQEDILRVIHQGQMDLKEAIEKCFDDYSDYFGELNNAYLNERGNDFNELKQSLLNFLDNTETTLICREYNGCEIGECVLENDHIIVAGELTASAVIRSKVHTRGIIAEKCGANSHAAIIARALGIPVIGGIQDPFRLIALEDDVLINGDNGEIIINPCEATRARYRTQLNKRFRTCEVVEPLSRFKVLADIERCDDVTRAIRAKADGIGLYRTEFEMLCRNRVLGEEEQADCYRQVLDNMKNKPVYFRLFDLGSDKSRPWLGIANEDNPALGCRGARFLLSRPELLKSQARAIARASRSAPINVIYPMITALEQFQQLKGIFLEAIAGLGETQIRHGIMFEVPSACLEAEELYEEIDFGRVGTNDLTQYLFACDRSSDDFCYEKLADHPASWKLLSSLAAVARRAGKPLELCGALVDNPAFIPRLIDLGITTISTHPDNIAAARKAAIACLSSKPQLCLI